MIDARAPAVTRDTMRRAVVGGLDGGLAGGLDAQSAALPFGTELAKRIASGGAAGLASDMPDAWLDELAEAGTPDEVRTMVERLAAAGADSVVLVAPPSVAPDDWLDLVERDLLPAVRTRSEDGPG
jgi:alkanesulfonate monooxygenase SsuD/methylene tetrahydromethanopterin reductase-like flavin-dependent oxidoreductase (luciferase family)